MVAREIADKREPWQREIERDREIHRELLGVSPGDT